MLAAGPQSAAIPREQQPAALCYSLRSSTTNGRLAAAAVRTPQQQQQGDRIQNKCGSEKQCLKEPIGIYSSSGCSSPKGPHSCCCCSCMHACIHTFLSARRSSRSCFENSAAAETPQGDSATLLQQQAARATAAAGPRSDRANPSPTGEEARRQRHAKGDSIGEGE